MKTPSLQSGYSLVEVLIAVAVLLLSITGPITIASKSLQTSYNTRDQVVATYLAQEAVEGISAFKQDSVITAIRAGNFNQTWNWAGSGTLSDCFSNGCNFDMTVPASTGFKNTFTPCTSSTDCVMTVDNTIFRRVVNLSSVPIPGGRDAIEVTVTVTWENAGFSSNSREVSISTILYDVYGDL